MIHFTVDVLRAGFCCGHANLISCQLPRFRPRTTIISAIVQLLLRMHNNTNHIATACSI